MPINEVNLKLINDLEKTLKEQLIWLSRNAVQITSETVNSYRNLRQFIIGISVAIIGVVFPIMLANQTFKNNEFFIVSLFYLSFVVVYGVSNLILFVMRDLVGMPSVVRSNQNRLLKMIEEVQKIKQIEINDEAGKKYEELKGKYSKEFPMEKLHFFQKIWRRYEGLCFFGFFIVGYIFLIIGFFK